VINYLIAMAILWGVWALLALALNLQWGLTGLVNFGHVAFFAVGAYTSGLLALGGVPFPLALAAAALLAALFGVAVALSTQRLDEDYLAVVTLGFAETVRLVILNETWLTEGARGLPGIPSPLRARFGEGYERFYLVLVLVAVGATFVVAERIRTAPLGRVLRAIRESSIVAAVAGKDVASFKLEAFAIGAAVAGIAGSLYAHYLTFLSPDQFDSTVTIYVWIAVIIGGSGNNKGALLGAFVLMALLEGSRFLKDLVPIFSGVRLAAIRLIMVGLLLILFMIRKPEGLWREEKPRPV
jgi:branched-chain amino acid transport system permease protein